MLQMNRFMELQISNETFSCLCDSFSRRWNPRMQTDKTWGVSNKIKQIFIMFCNLFILPKHRLLGQQKLTRLETWHMEAEGDAMQHKEIQIGTRRTGCSIRTNYAQLNMEYRQRNLIGWGLCCNTTETKWYGEQVHQVWQDCGAETNSENALGIMKLWQQENADETNQSQNRKYNITTHQKEEI